MKINRLWRMFFVVVMSTPLLAQKTVQPGEPVNTGTPSQTLFAYSSFGARLLDALTGNSALPPDVPVALAAVDPSALANAKVNSTLTFRVAYELDLKGYAYAYAGTLIEAKVIRIREGELRMRRGKLEPSVMEIAVPGLLETSPPPAPESLKLTLESTPRSRSSKTVRRLTTLPLTVPLKAIHIAILVPEDLMLAIVCGTSGCDL